MQKDHVENSDYNENNTLGKILNVISEGVWDWNASNGYVHRSSSWYKMLKYDEVKFANDVFTWENLIHPDDYESVVSHFEDFLNGKIAKYEIEYQCKKSDDTYLWILDTAQIVSRNTDGSVARIIGAHQDIHDKKIVQNDLYEMNKLLKQGNITLENMLAQKNEELLSKNKELEEKLIKIEYLSVTDTLTNISNRRMFEIMIKKEFSRAKRYKHDLSIIIIDIDFFKKVNDTYGHKYGDKVLCELATLLQKTIRENDFLARWGGEEFAILLPDTNIEHCVITSEKLRKSVSQMEFSNGLTITCSFGISQYKLNENLDELFIRADKALYNAKENGRNKVEFIK